MAEVEIFGAGIFGLTVAYCLQDRGLRVRVIEKRHVGAGASGGVVGALAPHTPDNWNAKKQFQFESLIQTEAFWREVDAISGLSSGYGRIGRLTGLANQRELALAHDRTHSAKTLWQGQAAWLVVPKADHDDWGPASDTGFVVEDTLSARMSPYAACASLARAVRSRGGEILEGCDAGLGADARVLATGYEGLEDLALKFAKPFGKGVKGQGMLLAHDAGEKAQIFTDGLHIIPHADGTVAIGSTSEIDWNDATATDSQLDALYHRATQACPALVNAPVLRRWAGVRPRGIKRSPIIGAHPNEAGTFIANGGFKIGFGVAVGVGKKLADLIATGRADIPDSFLPEANLT